MIIPQHAEDIRDCFRYGLLADVIWHEARGQEYEGKVGVGEAVINRLNDARWPDEIDEVIMQKNQFSCFRSDDPNNAKRPKPDDLEFMECCRAAAAALNGSRYTSGANHYLNPATVLRVSGKLPSWYDESKVTVTIGDHVFLRL